VILPVALKRLLLLGLLLVPTAVSWSQEASPNESSKVAKARRKNIVLFVNDDLGCDIGCYGNPAIRTPNMDQLASDGVRFTNAFCTTASCSSSRSVILTGLYSHANAQYGLAHAEHHFASYDATRSLPVMLAQNGYRTALVGKLHVLPEAAYRFDQVLKANPRNSVQMAEACRQVVEADSEQPFFLYFCPADPHRSQGTVQVGEVAANPFGNEARYPGVKEEKYLPSEVIVPPFLPDTPACRAELAQYYQSTSRIDQGLGRLRQILQEAKVADDTLIVFTSDNGIAFPGAKTTLYDPGMQVPLIVYDPALTGRAGQEATGMVSHVDLTPTLLEYAGVKPPAKLHGRSWRSLLADGNAAGWDEVMGSHTFHEVTMYYPMRVVRTRQYKFIWNIAHELEYPFASDLFDSATWQDALRRGPDSTYGKRTVEAFLHRDKYELYDLSADPHESENLASLPQHAPLLKEMVAKTKAFQQKTKDPWLLKWEHE
jgi:N-sulfoglucosamine sulfohydrolase